MYCIRLLFLSSIHSRRLVNVAIVFTFVALWHEMNLKLLAWGWMISLAFIPELAILGFFASKRMAWFRKKWFYRHLAGTSCTALYHCGARAGGKGPGVRGQGGMTQGAGSEWMCSQLNRLRYTSFYRLGHAWRDMQGHVSRVYCFLLQTVGCVLLVLHCPSVFAATADTFLLCLANVVGFSVGLDGANDYVQKVCVHTLLSP